LLKGKHLKKILSTVIGALVGLMLLCTMTGCGGSSATVAKMTTANTDDSQITVTALENAKVITLKKSFITFGGDSWSVNADGKEVATIKGQAFYLIGDTYSMYSTAGNFVGAEGEKYRLLNHAAQMYDFNGKESGVIKESFNFPFNSFDFTDAAGRKNGSMSQDLSLVFSGTAKDARGVEAWKFSKTPFSIGAELTVKREQKSNIPAMTAVWTAVIMNEISEAKNDSSSSSSTSKK
jgi:hypothetical protein